MTEDRSRGHRLAPLAIAAILVVAGGLAGCAGTSPTSPPGTPTLPSTGPSIAPDPSQDGGGGTIVEPSAPFVEPKPGQLDVRPIPADALEARVDGRRVTVIVTWTSGVEPCNVLDHVEVRTGDASYRITLFEGRGPGDQVCIAIAAMHRTAIDLGELEPGTYTISDGQDNAAPIEVIVD